MAARRSSAVETDRLAADVAPAGVARRAHEDVRTAAISEHDGRAGVIDEQLLAGTIDRAHRALELHGEAPVCVAELRAGVGLAGHMIGALLMPRQHKADKGLAGAPDGRSVCPLNPPVFATRAVSSTNLVSGIRHGRHRKYRKSEIFL